MRLLGAVIHGSIRYVILRVRVLSTRLSSLTRRYVLAVFGEFQTVWTIVVVFVVNSLRFGSSRWLRWFELDAFRLLGEVAWLNLFDWLRRSVIRSAL